MPDVALTLFTDPACPWSWAAEPARRAVAAIFGEQVRTRLVMAGLAREVGDPLAALRAWLDAAAASAMPADARLWLEAPPRSTYPACLAVKAAAEQGLDAAYLRRAREGFALERRALDSAEALVELARGVAGLDVERFRVDLASNAIVEAFGADLELARPGGERLALPSLRAAGPGGEHWARGTHEPQAWLDAVAAAGAQAGAPRAEPLAALREHGPMATAEVAAACGMPGPTAPAELWRLAAAWQVRVHREAGGETWEAS